MPLGFRLSSSIKKVKTITKHYYEANASTSINIPSTALEGDFAFIWNHATDGSGDFTAPSTVLPTGWTSVDNRTLSITGFGFATRVQMIYKELASGDINTSVTLMNGSFSEGINLIIFRPSFTTSSISASSAVYSFTNGDPSSQNILSSAGSSPLIVLSAFVSSSDITGDVSFSPSADEILYNSTFSNASAIAYKIYNEIDTPADHNIDMTDQGNINYVGGFYVALS